MKVKIYIGEESVNLFDDEKIEITQKLNDIEKLSNVFTDFTNSFNIPADPHNNKVMKHFYNPDIVNGYNLSIRIDGFIEIDTLPFKFGQWQLEECIMKDGYPESYKITFYSKTSQISKLFGEDVINMLDYMKDFDTGETEAIPTGTYLSQFNYLYTNTNFFKTINDPTFTPSGNTSLSGSVITPLIAYSDRDWNYGASDTNDISINSGVILDSELKPALQCIRILEAIEIKYGITFSRDFFGLDVFKKLYIWLNNNTISDGLVSTRVNFTNPNFTNGTPPSTFQINTTDDYIITSASIYSIGFKINPSGGYTTVPYTLKRYEDDVLVNTWEYPNGGTTTYVRSFHMTNNKKSQFFVETSEDFVFSSQLGFLEDNTSNFLTSVQGTQNSEPTTTLYNTLPSMKVIDFLQAFMKMFKLIIRPTSQTNFYVDTIDNFYNNGNILDITNFVNMDSVTISRPVIYNSLIFKYLKTDNVTGKNWREKFDPIADEIGYGDIKTTYPLIKENNELKVELPFENMLFEKLTYLEPSLSAGTATNILIGQSVTLNDDNVTVSKHDSKAIIFYNNGLIDISDNPIKMRFRQDSIQTINSVYNVANCNNLVFTAVTQSINWNANIDPWHEQVLPQSLINNYWKNWIETIYSIKQRKFNFKAVLPPRYIQEISLNDRIIIGNNRYKINDYTIDLVTGESKLNLFNDIY